MQSTPYSRTPLMKPAGSTMTLTGIAASPGLAGGTAYVYSRPDLTFATVRIDDVDGELERFRRSAKQAENELITLKESVRSRLGDEFAHIFRSQQTIAEDEAILGEVEERIRDAMECAEAALQAVFGGYIALFEELDDDDYNKTRAADIQDVHKRILRCLLGLPEADLENLPVDSIVVAEDLLPSDTATMNIRQVVGMVTEKGGATSHVAILANNLGIPAVVGVGNLMESIEPGDRILLDGAVGEAGNVTVRPSEEDEVQFRERRAAAAAHRAHLESGRDLPVATKDGFKVTLSANIGSLAELDSARDSGAESIGLFRTEFLFLDSPQLPTEDEQYAAYRKAAESFSEGFVIIRTLDIGGDKQIPSLLLPQEENPFLGNRALRLTLDRPELFISQMKAILRAGVHGSVKMMFPMVSGVPELKEALTRLEEAKKILETEGTAHDPDVECGIMVEIPSAVWSAEALARHIAFFSIGTNDLTQYLLATDRLNADVSRYYRIFDPSVFRAIGEVTRAAGKQNRWVGVCGELGGNPHAVPLLVGLGVTELSMSPRAIAEAAWLIRESEMSELRQLADRVLEQETDTAIKTILKDYYMSKEKQDK